jgi:predicted acetyltransferase
MYGATMIDIRLLPYEIGDEPEAVAAFRMMKADDDQWFSPFWNEEMVWGDFVQRQRDARAGIEGGIHSVPTAQLKAVFDGEIVGRVSIRFRLSERLFKDGGHIGYYLLPQFRGRGYGTELLRQSLIIIRAEGVSDVLMMCEDENTASAAVIERCGGVLEAVVAADDARLVRRYWIA